MIGTSLDRYKIVDELGHGGMSTVYRGCDEALERDVAIKVMHDHLAKSVENRKRFHREAKAIAKLKHPNILEIYDYSSFEATRSYIVMELIEGMNLRQFVDKFGRIPSEIVALIGLQISEALSHAHQSGVIHRDLKPENVMVSDSGQIKLMDFGIAHVVGAETMTQTGSILGSPAHMPPEIIDGQPVDIRSDLYSLGTIFYYLSTGVLPYTGVNAPQVFKKVLTGVYEDPEFVESRVGGRFGEIIKKCMEKEPDDRYQTVRALVESLNAFLDFVPLSEQDELALYFDDPMIYIEAFPKRIVPILISATRRLEDKNNVPKLVAYFNRILAYEPDNVDVKAMMKSLGRKKTTRSALVFLALLLTVFVGLYTYKVWPEKVDVVSEPKLAPLLIEPDPIEAAPDKIDVNLHASNLATMLSKQITEESQIVAKRYASRLAQVEPPKNSRDANEKKKVATVQTNNQTTPKTATTDPSSETIAPIKQETYPYRFSLTPAAAIFSIDGRNYDVLAARRGIELEKGRHRLIVRSPGAKTIKKVLDVRGAQKSILPIVLDWKPGRVQVITNTNAVVWIEKQNFKRISPGGKNATFSVPFGASDRIGSKKRITIRVASTQDMGHPKVQRVLVKPGQLTTINVNF